MLNGTSAQYRLFSAINGRMLEKETLLSGTVWFIGLYGTLNTNWLYRAIGVGKISTRAGRQHRHVIKQLNNTINQENQTLFRLGLLETIPSPRLGFLRGVFLANHLASNDNLTRTTKR